MSGKKVFKSMDGNEAAAYASYAFTEVATIYPITPSSPMANHVDEWSAHGMKNLFGSQVRLMEMQAESGACAGIQGALEAGSLATTYTSAQGLMLMIPPMYRIAGLQLPAVMHVAARSVATESVSIFGDHSDVMACRQIGWAQLASSSVQEAMDMGAVAHLSAIKGHMPVQHFFDGFRTSHEIQKIEVLDFEDLRAMVDWDELQKFRDRALNPEHPTIRNSGENDDIFFQHREAVNPAYFAFPAVVEAYMEKMSALTGRDYRLFNYFGAPDAERVIVAMGSVCEAAREVVDYLTGRGEKVGLIQVHLYRPFSMQHLLAAIPASCRILTALDRTKEPGALGEPLYEDVCTAVLEGGRGIQVLGGRYGLSSKDTTPAQIKAVFDNMKGEKKNHFTVGINDDVTHLSLPVGENIVTAGKSIISCKFWGLGSDGTVGANKNSCKIIGDNTDQYVQAYFQYDAKKSGGLTRSHLRFGHEPIRSTYYVTMADFVACHKQSYMQSYDSQARRHLPAEHPLEGRGPGPQSAEPRQAPAGGAQGAVLYHRRHRHRCRDRPRQPHQHRSAGSLLQALGRAPHRRGGEVYEGSRRQDLLEEGRKDRQHEPRCHRARSDRRREDRHSGRMGQASGRSAGRG